MDIKVAQEDMRKSYLGGGTGALVSGIVWLIAGLLAIYTTEMTSILVFFFGGMLIFPLSIVVSKLMGRNGQHQKGSPLATLAIESTIILFVGLFLAYVMFQSHSHYFFPTMLMIIGVRYVLFQSMYGMKLYWIFGLILILTGIGCFVSNQPFYMGGIVGGVIEIFFAVLILKIDQKNSIQEKT